MSLPSVGRVSTACSCGATFKVRRQMLGKRTHCPKCNAVFLVKDVDNPQRTDAELSLIDGLVAVEQSGTAVQHAGSRLATVKCPKCKARMAADAAICIHCGFEPQQATGCARGTVQGAASAAGRVATETGAFLLGCFLSAVGAVVGAVLWLVFSLLTGWIYGIVGVAVGALAGAGMKLGYRKEKARAGFAASMMTLFGILLSKVLLFFIIVAAAASGSASNMSAKRALLTTELTEQILDDQSVVAEKDREAARPAAREQAQTMVDKMDDEEVESRMIQLKGSRAQTLAMIDPLADFKRRMRLLDHRVERRCEHEGFPLFGVEHDNIHLQEWRTVRDFSRNDLEKAIKELNAWEAGGKWSDDQYLHDHLLCRMVEDDFEQKRLSGDPAYAGWSPSERHWRGSWKNLKPTAGQMSRESQLARLKEMVLDEEEDSLREVVARHWADVRGNVLGMSYVDSRRDDLYDEEFAKADELTGDSLETAHQETVDWKEKGRWSKPEYIRAELIYGHIEQDIESAASTDEYVSLWNISDDEWLDLYAAAIVKFEDVPEDQLAHTLKDFEAERDRKQKEKLARELGEELEENASEIAGGFFTTMFVPIDCLFLLLAVALSFRIASGES